MKQVRLILLTFLMAGVGSEVMGQTSIRIVSPASGTNENTMLGIGVPAITSGARNTFIGRIAGRDNTTGTDNTFTGGAGYRNTTGSQNVFFGWNAGSQNITGSNNTSVGVAAGAYNNNYNNVFMGTATGHYTMGDANVILGSYAGYQYHGSGNILIGYTAAGGYPGTYLTGNNNTLLGTGSYFLASGLTNATAIGYNAKVGASNSLVLGGTGVDAVNVGIGVTSPTARFHNVGSVRLEGITQDNTFYKVAVFDANDNLYWRDASTLGGGATYTAGTGIDITNNVISSTIASLFTANGTNISNNNTGNVGIGTGTGTVLARLTAKASTSTSAYTLMALSNTNTPMFSVRNDAYIAINNATPTALLSIKGKAATAASSSLNITNSVNTPLFFVRNDGNVGIGTTAPTAKLHIDGTTSNTLGLSVYNKDLIGANLPAGFYGNTTGMNYVYTSTTGVANTNGRIIRLQDMRGTNLLYDMGIDINNSFFINKMGALDRGFVMSSNGNVGIGLANTTIPSATLHINGNLRFEGVAQDNSYTQLLVTDTQGNVAWRDANSITSQWANITNGIEYNAGNVTVSNGYLHIGDNQTILPSMLNPTAGVNVDDYGLVVSKGKGILTTELKVALKNGSEWYDDETKLERNLAKKAAEFEQNKHLTSIPSADELVKGGIDVKTMFAQMVKEHEETLLFLRDLKKEIDALKVENETLKATLNK